MKKALDRFNEVIFNPAIRWYVLPKPSVRRFRYPAPASEPINHDENVIDYKTAFRDSAYDIRYHHEVYKSDASYHFAADPVSESTTERLVRYGYLAAADVSNPDLVASAAKAFEQKEGRAPSNNIVVDQVSKTEQPVTKENRESVAHAVRQAFENVRDVNVVEIWSNNLDERYNPEFYNYKTYDMLADDPVYRQLKLDLEWQFENWAERRESAGYIPTFKGDPNFWQTLDNSFSPKNIALVQNSINDTQTNTDLATLEANHQTDQYHKTSKLVYPIESKIVTE